MASPINYIAFSTKPCYTFIMDISQHKINFSHNQSEYNEINLYKGTHFHNDYELYFIVSGDVEYVVGDAIYSLQPYDLLLIKPTVYHHPRFLSQALYDRYVINFSLAAIDEHLLPILQTDQVFFRFSDNQTVKNLYVAWDKFMNNAEEKDAYIFCRQLINLLLLQLKYADTNHQKEIIHPMLTKILAYIDAHLDEPLDVNSIAKRFFVSPSWIFYIFKKKFFISYSQYIQNKKMLYAEQLIRSGTPLTQVAFLCGFREYSTFFRQYKRHFKTAPQNHKFNH